MFYIVFFESLLRKGLKVNK